MLVSTLPFKVLGFALAVRDLEECGRGMDRESLVEALINYAKEYELEQLATAKESKQIN